ncbi:MAG TPA: NAD(P)-dependent oxidoreductase [Burkholderiales bacterium]|jgi:3-hydroxyisobutyrate dehydrogenase
MATKIGFIGLGMMGAPMAANLLKGGFEVVGFDVKPENAKDLQGQKGFMLASGLNALEGLSKVILMVPNSKIVDSLLWEQGLAKLTAKGGCIIDMSSSEPLRSQANAKKLKEAGLNFIDAPVSGGVKRARDGSLAIMIGGEEAAVKDAMPVFEAMGKTLVHVGTAGAGHAVKALNNYVSASGLLAVCEALTAAEKFGIDPHVANKVFSASTGKNNTTDNKVEQFMLNGAFNSGFALGLMRKDLDTALAFIEAVGTPAGFAGACAHTWRDADAALPSGDHTAMYAFVHDRKK